MNFIVAEQEHDEQLRMILRSESMPGRIRVTYEREPNFFHGLKTQGTFNQVVAAVENGQVLGFGCRSVRPMFINGSQMDFGYLSGLRSSAKAKQKFGIARGYRAFRKLHRDERCTGYITSIIEGNSEAEATIAQGRAGLPFYRYLGECNTYAILLKKRRFKQMKDVSIRFAKKGEENRVIHALRSFGKALQFFPAFSATDFESPLLRDLDITRFLVAEQKEEIRGVAAVWDQSAFKQHRINQYSRTIAIGKVFINPALRLSGYHSLPQEGERINHAYFCFKVAKDNNPEILGLLLNHACCHLQESGFSHCITGFHNNDPASSITRNLAMSQYRSRLYFVGWESELETFNQLDSRHICFEPAIL